MKTVCGTPQVWTGGVGRRWNEQDPLSTGKEWVLVCQHYFHTPVQYVAPEVIMARKNMQYGPGVDMWSAGVVLFILLGGGLFLSAST